MKTSKKSGSWHYPSFAESWRGDFIKQIPRSKSKRELKEYADLVDWERIGDLLSSEAKAIMKKIGIPESKDSLRFDSLIIEAIILTNIKERLHYLFLHYLSSINKTDTKPEKNIKIKTMLDRLEFEIKRSRSFFNMILDVGSLKWIKNSDTLEVKLNEVQKQLSSYYGKKVKEKRKEYYGEIFKKNDEYIINGVGSNFRRATEKVAIKYNQVFENLYKAFNKFKNKNDLHTYEDFEKKCRL